MSRLEPANRFLLFRRFSYALLGCSLLVTLTGCGSWNWRGAGFRDELDTRMQKDVSRWGESGRMPAMSGERMGLSEKSQQVERNLGF
jgi:hypothetical protein